MPRLANGLAGPGVPLGRKVIEELPHGLIKGLRDKQPEARAEFFRRYAPQVRRILYLQGFCDEVDDAVQDVFIKVYRASMPQEEKFLAWFYQIILNVGRDQGRRQRTRSGLMQRLEHIATDVEADPPSGPSDPALRDALARLSPEFRECVALRFFADLSMEAIADAQEIPIGTVKSRLHAAMAQLRRALDEQGFVQHV